MDGITSSLPVVRGAARYPASGPLVALSSVASCLPRPSPCLPVGPCASLPACRQAGAPPRLHVLHCALLPCVEVFPLASFYCWPFISDVFITNVDTCVPLATRLSVVGRCSRMAFLRVVLWSPGPCSVLTQAVYHHSSWIYS